MRIFTGILSRNSIINSSAIYKNVQLAFPSIKQNIKQWKNSNNTLNIFYNSQNGQSQELFVYDAELKIAIAGDVQLNNKDELERELSLANYSIRDCNSLNIVLLAYTKWGKKCVQHLLGNFSFIIWDENKNSIICVRDHLGQKPLFYYLDDNKFIFSNWIHFFDKYPIINNVSNSSVLLHLQQINILRDSTFFQNIKRLLPAHILSLTNLTPLLSCYWRLEDTIGHGSLSFNDAIEKLKWYLVEAIKSAAEDYNRIGIELSSGIDSSSIAAIFQNNIRQDKKLIAFTNTLPYKQKNKFNNFKDEWKKAVEITRHLNISTHFRVDTYEKDPIDFLKESLDIIGYPINNFFVLHQSALYDKLKSAEVDCLLSGFGGNEIVSENATRNFDNNLLKALNFNNLTKIYKSRGDNFLKSYVRTIYNYASYINPFEVWDRKNFNLIEADWNTLCVKDRYLDKKAKRSFIKDSLYPSFQTVREKTILRVNDANLTERLEGCYFYSSNKGFNYKYPLLSVPLIECYFNVKDEWKACNPIGRGLLREVVKELLPQDVIFKPKFGNTSNIPHSKVFYANNFIKLREACLSIDTNHSIFEFIDRTKLERNTKVYSEDICSLMEHIILPVLFLDKHANKKSNGN